MAPAELTLALTYGTFAALTAVINAATVVLAKVAVPVFNVAVPASVADIVKLFAEINGPGVVSLPVITVAPRATLSRISKVNFSSVVTVVLA